MLEVFDICGEEVGGALDIKLLGLSWDHGGGRASDPFWVLVYGSVGVGGGRDGLAFFRVVEEERRFVSRGGGTGGV